MGPGPWTLPRRPPREEGLQAGGSCRESAYCSPGPPTEPRGPIPSRTSPQDGWPGTSQGARPQPCRGARLPLRELSSEAKVLAFW